MSTKKLTDKIKRILSSLFEVKIESIRLQYSDTLCYNKNFTIKRSLRELILNGTNQFFYIGIYNKQKIGNSWQIELKIFKIPTSNITQVFNIICKRGRDEGNRYNTSFRSDSTQNTIDKFNTYTMLNFSLVNKFQDT